MRKKEVYLNWANSVLSEAGKYVDCVSAIQGGRVLCELIDILTGQPQLVDIIEKSTSGDAAPQQWIDMALQHMRSHGIKYTFKVQDILDGDIKSLLDVLWLTILNYSLHDIDQNAYQRSVGIGKKYLMEWCEHQLETKFDSRNTFAFNLCQDNWFSKLLQKYVGADTSGDQDRVTTLNKLLETVEKKFSISRDIISASDILDGTVDEHTLMIYVALLRRRVGGDNRLQSLSSLRKPPGGMNMDIIDVTKRSRSASPVTHYKSPSEDEDRFSSDSELFRVETRNKQYVNRKNKSSSKPVSDCSTFSKCPSNRKGSPHFRFEKHVTDEDLSNWVSSSSHVSSLSDRNGQNQSPTDNCPVALSSHGENLLKETISQQVYEHLPHSENEEEGLKKGLEPIKNIHMDDKSLNVLDAPFRSSSGTEVDSSLMLNGGKQIENEDIVKQGGSAVKIKRPKDYFLQWENTLDRLSQGPSSTSVQSSRSQSEFDLESGSGRSRSSSHSRSRSHESQSMLRDYSHTSSLVCERGKNFASMYRGKCHSQPDSMKKYIEERTRRRDKSHMSDFSAKHLSESDLTSKSHENGYNLSDLNLSCLSNTSVTDLQSHPMFPNLKSLLSSLDPLELDILNRSSDPPDVLTLLESIKKARMAVDNNMLKDDLQNKQAQPKEDHTCLKKAFASSMGITGSDRKSASLQRSSDHTKPTDNPFPKMNRQELSPSPSSGRSMQNERQKSFLQKSCRPSYSSKTRSPGLDAGSPINSSVDILNHSDGRVLPNAGFGHLPRREAWERQKNKGRGVPTDKSRIDSLAQARFIEVLCREIEELRYRMDTMESSDEGGQTSPSPTSNTKTERMTKSVYPTGTEIEALSHFSDIHEQNGHMLFESSRSRSLSPIYTRQRKSPDFLRRVSYERTLRNLSAETRQNNPDYSRSRSLSPTLERHKNTEQKLRALISPERFAGSKIQLHNKMVDSSFRAQRRESPSPYQGRSSQLSDRYETVPLAVSTASPVGSNKRGYTVNDTDIPQVKGNDQPLNHEGQTRTISLGYSSPVRSVTQEIWGNKLSSIKGLEPERQDRWKNLIAMQELSDEDIIELKQALASSIVENDILQAKLRNAKADVSEKLFKTNDVLDDCRRHLAKSQAENMELRTNLEHECQKAEAVNSRIKSLENNLFHAQSESEQLEIQLRETTDALNKSMIELQAVEDLKQINQHLRIQLSTVEDQNESLRQDIDEMQYNQDKAQSTIKELRTCLEEVREERSQLFQEINALHASNQKSKVADIIKHYAEKKACDQVEPEELHGLNSQQSSQPSSASLSWPSTSGHTSRSGPDITHRSRIDDYICPLQETSDTPSCTHQRRSSVWNKELDSSPCKLNSSLNLSGNLADTTSSRDTGYSTEDMLQSPNVPSSFREIYPHRKSQYYRNKQRETVNLDCVASPIPFVDYSDLQQYPTKLGYSEFDIDDSYLVTRNGSKDYGSLGESLSDRQHRDISVQDSIFTEDLNQYESSPNYSLVQDIVVESPSAAYQQPCSDSSDRPPQSSHEVHQRSYHVSRRSEDRVNLSSNAIYDKDVRNSQSQNSKKGILKNGKTEHPNHLRERSCSPVLQRYGRSHSPPTRLYSSNKSDRRSETRKPVFGRSSSARRNTSKDEFDVDVGRNFDLKSSYSRAKSWYQLQLQEPSILSDAQRRYADHLIEKYTGQRIPSMETY